MNLKSINWGLLVLVAVLFIGVGDRVLPSPLKEVSANTRNSINKFVIGLVPHWKPSVDPYKRTEDAVKKEEGHDKQ